MTRTITTTTGVTFTIEEEFDGELHGTPQICAKKEDLGYITTGTEGYIDCFHLQSASMTFKGAITPTSEATKGELQNWQFGVCQNVTAYRHQADYGSGYQITETLQYPVPIRDGDDGSLPFSYTAVEELALGVKADLASLQESDEPNQMLPQEITADARLENTSGTSSLRSWMVLARVAAPRQIILLGRMDWSVYLNARITHGVLNFTADPVTEITGIDILEETYNKDDIPALDSGLVPDLREDGVEANEYRQGALTQGGVGQREWVFGDEDQARPWERRENPSGNPNWISNDRSASLWVSGQAQHL
jgi:hypothetical protein